MCAVGPPAHHPLAYSLQEGQATATKAEGLRIDSVKNMYERQWLQKTARDSSPVPIKLLSVSKIQ